MKTQAQYNRQLQDRYKRLGLCAQCGKNQRELDRVVCIGCKYRTRKNGRAYRLRLKLKAYSKYGGANCSCCKETSLEFLTLDHIDGGGRAHRLQVGGGDKLYRWLQNNNYPSGFRVLCFNCNYAVFRYGTCPHQNPISGRLSGKEEGRSSSGQ